MKLTESINRRLLNEGESLYNRILDVVADRKINDDDLVLAVGDDAIRVRNEKTNKEVWVKPEDNDDGIESKITSILDKKEESGELEEASKGERNTSPDWLVDILNRLHDSYEFIDFSATHLKYKENETHLVRIFTNDEDKIPDNVTELKMLIAKGLPEGFDIKSEGGYKAYGSGGFVYTFEVYKTNVEESEDLEEASLWDSLPDEFKGKIAGANEIVSKLQSLQGVNATAEVSGNNLTLTLTGDLLKAMDAVDTIRDAAEGKGLKVNANYGEKNFIVTITQ